MKLLPILEKSIFEDEKLNSGEKKFHWRFGSGMRSKAGARFLGERCHKRNGAELAGLRPAYTVGCVGQGTGDMADQGVHAAVPLLTDYEPPSASSPRDAAWFAYLGEPNISNERNIKASES